MTKQPHVRLESLPPLYLNVVEAAEKLRLAVSTLNKMRVRGDGPPYLKLGRRVLYSEDDLRDWAEARTMKSTSDYETRVRS
jgi:predicted DNA-binding transcriptional regulator AlpA